MTTYNKEKICGECNEPTKRLYTVDDNLKTCKSCYYTIKFYKIFGYDTNVKVFVDVFPINEKFYLNIIVLDFVNEDFRAITRLAIEKNLNRAKYEAILRVCELIDDFTQSTIYTHFKIVKKQLNGEYGSKKLREPLFHLRKYIKKGLKLEFIDQDLNYAIISPHVFKIFHLFEDYNRKMYLQKRN